MGHQSYKYGADLLNVHESAMRCDELYVSP